MESWKFAIFNDEVIIANEQPRKDVRLRGKQPNKAVRESSRAEWIPKPFNIR